MAATISLPCNTCGQARNVRRRDVHRIKQCRRCHLTQIASKGYAATQAKYGQKFAVRFVRDYRLANPSSLEQVVMNWLDCQRVCYEREFWLEMTDQVYLVDFIIGCVAVEVNGTWAHQFHVDRDRRKLAALRDCGFAVVALSEADVLTGAFVRQLNEALSLSEFFVTNPIRTSLSGVTCYADDMQQTLATRRV